MLLGYPWVWVSVWVRAVSAGMGRWKSCQTTGLEDDSENPKCMDAACPVRPCVITTGLANCAYCGDYVRDNLRTRIAEYEGIAGTLFNQPS